MVSVGTVVPSPGSGEVTAGASVVVGGSVGMVTSAGLSPLMAGVGGPSLLQALEAPTTRRRPAARASARRRGRGGVWMAEGTAWDYHFDGG